MSPNWTLRRARLRATWACCCSFRLTDARLFVWHCHRLQLRGRLGQLNWLLLRYKGRHLAASAIHQMSWVWVLTEYRFGRVCEGFERDCNSPDLPRVWGLHFHQLMPAIGHPGTAWSPGPIWFYLGPVCTRILSRRQFWHRQKHLPQFEAGRYPVSDWSGLQLPAELRIIPALGKHFTPVNEHHGE